MELYGFGNTQGKFTRTITVSAASRNGGNIVASGGSSDDDTRQVTSSVTWDATTARQKTIALSIYLTNWEKAIAPPPPAGP